MAIRSTLSSFPGSAEVKASACNVGDLGSIPGSGRASGEGNGNPLRQRVDCLSQETWREESGSLQSMAL